MIIQVETHEVDMLLVFLTTMQVINTKKKMKKKKYVNSGTVSVAKKHTHSTMPLRTPSLLAIAGQVMLRLCCFIQCNMRNSENSR